MVISAGWIYYYFSPSRQYIVRYLLLWVYFCIEMLSDLIYICTSYLIIFQLVWLPITCLWEWWCHSKDNFRKLNSNRLTDRRMDKKCITHKKGRLNRMDDMRTGWNLIYRQTFRMCVETVLKNDIIKGILEW